MTWTCDSQGRVSPGRDVIEKCGIQAGDKLVFQKISTKKFRILAEKDATTEEVLAISAVTVDCKGRFFLPSIIRKRYKNEFCVSYNVSEKSIYITFSEFAE